MDKKYLTDNIIYKANITSDLRNYKEQKNSTEITKNHLTQLNTMSSQEVTKLKRIKSKKGKYSKNRQMLSKRDSLRCHSVVSKYKKQRLLKLIYAELLLLQIKIKFTKL